MTCENCAYFKPPRSASALVGICRSPMSREGGDLKRKTQFCGFWKNANVEDEEEKWRRTHE